MNSQIFVAIGVALVASVLVIGLASIIYASQTWLVETRLVETWTCPMEPQVTAAETVKTETVMDWTMGGGENN